MVSYLPTMHHPNLSSAGIISSSVIRDECGCIMYGDILHLIVKADRQRGEEVLAQQEYVNH